MTQCRKIYPRSQDISNTNTNTNQNETSKVVQFEQKRRIQPRSGHITPLADCPGHFCPCSSYHPHHGEEEGKGEDETIIITKGYIYVSWSSSLSFLRPFPPHSDLSDAQNAKEQHVQELLPAPTSQLVNHLTCNNLFPLFEYMPPWQRFLGTGHGYAHRLAKNLESRILLAAWLATPLPNYVCLAHDTVMHNAPRRAKNLESRILLADWLATPLPNYVSARLPLSG